MSYTKGKWEFTGYDWEGQPIIVAGTEQTKLIAVAQAGDDDCPKIKEAEANARLIAAAPELLEACKLFQAAITEYHFRDIKKHYSLCVADSIASKAIAAAEGKE